MPQFPLLERDPPLLESLLLVPAVRGSEGSRGSGLHTPSTRWVWAVDSGMQGWGQGLPRAFLEAQGAGAKAGGLCGQHAGGGWLP